MCVFEFSLRVVSEPLFVPSRCPDGWLLQACLLKSPRLACLSAGGHHPTLFALHLPLNLRTGTLCPEQGQQEGQAHPQALPSPGDLPACPVLPGVATSPSCLRAVRSHLPWEGGHASLSQHR